MSLGPDPSALAGGPFLDLGEREADPSFAEPNGGQGVVETACELVDGPIADAESLGDLVDVQQRRGEAERVLRRPLGGVALAAWRETWGWVAGWAAIDQADAALVGMKAALSVSCHGGSGAEGMAGGSVEVDGRLGRCGGLGGERWWVVEVVVAVGVGVVVGIQSGLRCRGRRGASTPGL